jgi:surfeit locus 1 family protein
MSSAERLPRASDHFWFAVLVLIAVGSMLGLGFWQLDRKIWKEQLIDRLDRRLTGDVVDFSHRGDWAGLGQLADEFRRVTVTGRFVPGEEALIYTVGSPLRSDIEGQGYWVFAPLRLVDGDIIVVNRGFVPENRKDGATRPDGELVDAVKLVGVLRWPESRGWFAPPDEPAHNLWFTRDPGAIAATKRWGEIAPFYIDLEGPTPPGGMPRPGQMRLQLRNDHLQYALTWFSLAAALIVMFVIWLRGRIRSRRPS